MAFNDKQSRQNRLIALEAKIKKIEKQINHPNRWFKQKVDVNFLKRQIKALKIIKNEIEKDL